MLVFDLKIIGNKLYEVRTKKLLSRADVAETAGLSDRAYADIERGNVNMRIETLLKICRSLNITPNDILTTELETSVTDVDITNIMGKCSDTEKETARKLLHVYLSSLNKL